MPYRSEYDYNKFLENQYAMCDWLVEHEHISQTEAMKRVKKMCAEAKARGEKSWRNIECWRKSADEA